MTMRDMASIKDEAQKLATASPESDLGKLARLILDVCDNCMHLDRELRRVEHDLQRAALRR